MGYSTNYDGEITIDPPLTWAEIKDSPYLPDKAWNAGLDVKLRVREADVETDEGTLTRRSADAIVPLMEDAYKGYEIVKTVQAIIDTFPGHVFAGRFDCKGEETGDLWRLVVKNGRAVEVRPQIVWPDEADA